MKYTYYWWEKAISKKQCELILEETNWDQSMTAAITTPIKTNGQVNEKIRKTKICWQDPKSPAGCILEAFIRLANQQAGWNYDLNGIESVQIGEYKNDGHYDWHEDHQFFENGMQRKLSAVLLLNDPETFTGGSLEFLGVEDPPQLKQGSLVVFPSFVKHRVTPVTENIRYSAVTWMNGPNFK